MVCYACSLLAARTVAPTAACDLAHHAIVTEDRWHEITEDAVPASVAFLGAA